MANELIPFIKLARKTFKSDLWLEKRSFSKFEEWLDLIQSANFNDGMRIIDNKMISIEKGELVASYRFLAERWGWTKSKVERFLKKLEQKCSKIRTRTEEGMTVITLLNYDTYNKGQDSDRGDSGTVSGQRRDKEGEGKEGGEQSLPGLGGEKKVPVKKKKPLTAEQKKRAKVESNTLAMEMIGSIFGRRHNTLWSIYEAEALSELDDSDLAETELRLLSKFYAHEMRRGDDGRHRRSIDTLLNNWQGEMDKARNWDRASPSLNTPSRELTVAEMTANDESSNI